jgi:hypothetical protein
MTLAAMLLVALLALSASLCLWIGDLYRRLRRIEATLFGDELADDD